MIPRQKLNEHFSNTDLRLLDRHSPVEYARAIVYMVCVLSALLVLFSLLIAKVWFSFTFDTILSILFWLIVGCLFMASASFCTWLTIRLSQAELDDIGQFGSVIRRGIIGRRTEKVYAPRAAVSTVVANREAKDNRIKVPRLLELLPDGLTAGEENLVGYGLDGLPVYDEWHGVTAVIGGQNAGKSVTLVLLIAIALLRGYRVTVCDIHHDKPRSLFKKIKVLDRFITFAVTEDQIYQTVLSFIESLTDQSEKHFLVIDEYTRLIEKFASEQLRELLPQVINKAGREGHGYGKYLALGIHDLSDEGLGNSRLRGWFNFVYAHKIKQEQSHFLNVFNNKKMATLLEDLPRGHVITSNKDRLIVPFSDKTDVDKLSTMLKTLDAGSGYQDGYQDVHSAPTLKNKIVLKEERGEI